MPKFFYHFIVPALQIAVPICSPLTHISVLPLLSLYSIVSPWPLFPNLKNKIRPSYFLTNSHLAIPLINFTTYIIICNVRRAAVGVAFSNGRPAVLIGRYLIASFCVNYHSIMFCCSFHNRVRGNFIIQNHRCPALRFSL